MRIQPPFHHEMEDGYDTKFARRIHATKSYSKMLNIAYVEEGGGEELLEMVESEEHHGRYALTKPFFVLPHESWN